MIPAADLFAGGSGLSTGALLTGRVAVLWAANHWPDAVAWYRRNHPGTEVACQDLMQADWRALPDLSDGLLLAAPACQGFSSNGQPGRVVRGAAVKHQADRNTSWAVLAACDTARPRHLIVENVRQFTQWELFPGWVDMLCRMGYRLRVDVLNARDFGVPQDRPRMILHGHLDREPERIVPTGERSTLADVLEPHDAPGLAWLPIASKAKRKNKHGQSIADRMRAAQRRGGSECFWANVDSAVPRSFDDVAPTMTTKSESQWFVLRGDYCRKLTVPELARIQSFPAGMQWPEDSRLAGKLFGNATPPNLARAAVAQVVDAA